MKTKVVGKVLIILVVLILIAGGAFAYVYFGTDLLKSNEELFFKYLSQFGSERNGFFVCSVKEYTNIKFEGKYQDSGEFSMDVNISGMDSDIVDTLKNFKITYEGKIDNTERKNEQNITLNYSDDVKFPFRYKYANETVGLQADDVTDKYIAIENKNLKDLAKKFNIEDTDKIPDSIDLFENIRNNEFMKLSDEEKKQLSETYTPILLDNLEGKEFTKNEEDGGASYSVDITYEEAQKIMEDALKALKDDSILMPKLEEALKDILAIVNEISREEIKIEDIIQEMIDELEDTEAEEGEFTITVSQRERKLSSIKLEAEVDSAKVEVNMAKTKESDNLKYDIELKISNSEDEQEMRFFVTSSFQGLDKMETVNENYEYGITGNIEGEEMKMVYNLKCTDTFDDGITIEDFKEDEVQVLNDYDLDEIGEILMDAGQKIYEINEKQMDEIGFTEYGNPIMFASPILSTGMLVYQQAQSKSSYGYNTYDDDRYSNSYDDSDDNNSDGNDRNSGNFSDYSNELSEVEKSTFNAKFEQYEGTQRGTAVRALVQQVLANNLSQDSYDRKVEITGDVEMGKNDTQAPTTGIKSGSTYQVELTYHDGLVSEIMITEK